MNYKEVLKNIFSVIFGLIVGGIVNMSILEFMMKIIPPPSGFDLNSPEGLEKAMPFFEPIHFLAPFLAHAIGTLIGALIVGFLTKKLHLSLTVGVVFLIGGISMVFSAPSPLWFNIIDLFLAYIPMAYLGFIISLKMKPKK
jgi:hypothetical protein